MSKTLPPPVLLVQRADDGRDMYVEYFRHRRVPALVASNAREALAAAPDAAVIITAIRLHGPTDGVGLILQLRSEERTKNIPIIVLSGNAWQNERERCKDAGCDIFLPKPCLPDDLLREVRRLLASRRRARRRAGAVPQGHVDCRTAGAVVTGNG